MKKRLFTVIIAILSALILCFTFSACSGAEPNGGAGGKGESSIVTDATDRKIVYNVWYELTSSDIASLSEKITTKNKELGGYVQSNEQSYDGKECTYAYIVLRVPTEKLDTLVGEIEKEGAVSSKNVSTSDITENYVDATARKSALTTSKTALNDMLSDTTLTADEKIKIINEIAEIDKELMEIDLLLSSYDSVLEFSTVYVTIDEKASFIDFSGVFAIILVLGLIGATIFLGVSLGQAKNRLSKAEKRLKDTQEK